MAIIDDIKCPRCDRKYSGVRSRCPYCGARRIGFGKYSKDNDNAKGKMMISVLILAVFTVAAGVMLLSTPSGASADTPPPPTLSNPEDDGSSLQVVNTPSPTPPPPTDTPPPAVEQLIVLYGGNPLAFYPYFTQRISDGKDSSFNVKVEPVGIEGIDVVIESSDESIFTVERVYGGRENGFSVTGVSAGDAKLIITCGDVTETIHVSIR